MMLGDKQEAFCLAYAETGDVIGAFIQGFGITRRFPREAETSWRGAKKALETPKIIARLNKLGVTAEAIEVDRLKLERIIRLWGRTKKEEDKS